MFAMVPIEQEAQARPGFRPRSLDFDDPEVHSTIWILEPPAGAFQEIERTAQRLRVVKGSTSMKIR